MSSLSACRLLHYKFYDVTAWTTKRYGKSQSSSPSFYTHRYIAWWGKRRQQTNSVSRRLFDKEFDSDCTRFGYYVSRLQLKSRSCSCRHTAFRSLPCLFTSQHLSRSIATTTDSYVPSVISILLTTLHSWMISRKQAWLPILNRLVTLLICMTALFPIFWTSVHP